jgi:hypothetical protein
MRQVANRDMKFLLCIVPVLIDQNIHRVKQMILVA